MYLVLGKYQDDEDDDDEDEGNHERTTAMTTFTRNVEENVNQIKSYQTKLNPARPGQTRPSQVKPNQHQQDNFIPYSISKI